MEVTQFAGFGCKKGTAKRPFHKPRACRQPRSGIRVYLTSFGFPKLEVKSYENERKLNHCDNKQYFSGATGATLWRVSEPATFSVRIGTTCRVWSFDPKRQLQSNAIYKPNGVKKMWQSTGLISGCRRKWIHLTNAG